MLSNMRLFFCFSMFMALTLFTFCMKLGFNATELLHISRYQIIIQRKFYSELFFVRCFRFQCKESVTIHDIVPQLTSIFQTANELQLQLILCYQFYQPVFVFVGYCDDCIFGWRTSISHREYPCRTLCRLPCSYVS